MAQVGVQQPTNLMEMFSSPSMMLGDIAAQQVNDQTLGNLVNRQSAMQDQDIARQKLPFELQQLGLQNQEIEARIPGVRADSGLKQNNLKVSDATIDQQTKAKISELAKTVSDNDLAQAENGVKQLMVHPDPKIRASAKPLFDSLYEIRKERDKLAIEGGNAIALEKERGKNQIALEKQQASDGKYLKAFNAPIDIQIRASKNPEEKAMKINQAFVEAQRSGDQVAMQHYKDLYEAHKPLYDNYMKTRPQGTQGVINVPEAGGIPAVQSPTAPTLPEQDTSPTPQPQLGPKGNFTSEAAAEAALKAGQIKPGDIIVINGRKAKVQ